jgi:hypothetical protein
LNICKQTNAENDSALAFAPLISPFKYIGVTDAVCLVDHALMFLCVKLAIYGVKPAVSNSSFQGVPGSTLQAVSTGPAGPSVSWTGIQFRSIPSPQPTRPSICAFVVGASTALTLFQEGFSAFLGKTIREVWHHGTGEV